MSTMADSVNEPTSTAALASMTAGPNMSSVQNIIPILSVIADIQNVQRPVMAPLSAGASITTTTASTTIDNSDLHEEPENKRKKLDTGAAQAIMAVTEKLESRLGGILCCAVCLDLPRMAMYQVG